VLTAIIVAVRMKPCSLGRLHETIVDQEAIVEAIGAHLDQLQVYVEWVILFALATAWAGIQRERTIEALGLKFDRRHAFVGVGALYVLANIAVLVLVLRIGDLILLVDHGHLTKAISSLTTHPWVLNPFGYFGDTWIARIHSGQGLGLLIFVWWLCHVSLSTLMDDKKHRIYRVLNRIFLAIGVTAIVAIQRVGWIALAHVRATDTIFAEGIGRTLPERIVISLFASIVGVLVFRKVSFLHERRFARLKREPPIKALEPTA
jgi:hypothetical protein